MFHEWEWYKLCYWNNVWFMNGCNMLANYFLCSVVGVMNYYFHYFVSLYGHLCLQYRFHTLCLKIIKWKHIQTNLKIIMYSNKSQHNHIILLLVFVVWCSSALFFSISLPPSGDDFCSCDSFPCILACSRHTWLDRSSKLLGKL